MRNWEFELKVAAKMKRVSVDSFVLIGFFCFCFCFFSTKNKINENTHKLGIKTKGKKAHDNKSGIHLKIEVAAFEETFLLPV